LEAGKPAKWREEAGELGGGEGAGATNPVGTCDGKGQRLGGKKYYKKERHFSKALMVKSGNTQRRRGKGKNF